MAITEDLSHDLRLRRMTRAEYDRLVEEGWFIDEKVELLDGMVVEMSPQDGRHFDAIVVLTRIFVRGVRDDREVRPQGPFAADERSEPEPDLAVVATGSHHRYEHPNDALLVIEVSNTSRRTDLRLKARLYAQADIPEYWVVDVVGKVVHVHRAPVGTEWSSIVIHSSGTIVPVAVPEVAVDLAELFPED